MNLQKLPGMHCIMSQNRKISIINLLSSHLRKLTGPSTVQVKYSSIDRKLSLTTLHEYCFLWWRSHLHLTVKKKERNKNKKRNCPKPTKKKQKESFNILRISKCYIHWFSIILLGTCYLDADFQVLHFVNNRFPQAMRVIVATKASI